MVEEGIEKMPKNTFAALSYIIPVFSFISGAVALTLRRSDEYVRFHAIQSIGLSVIWVFGIGVLTIIPILGWVLLPFWWLVMFVFWLVAIVKAYQGEKFVIPIIGSYIQDFSKKLGL